MSSDEPELEFSGSSRAEPSWGTLISELKPSWKKKFLAIFPRFCLYVDHVPKKFCDHLLANKVFLELVALYELYTLDAYLF